MDHLTSLRHTLHKYPEISNNEYQTAERITEFIKKYKPDDIIKLGNTGRAFVFNSKKPGKTLMFRAELDALPIREENNIPYISQNKDIAHACGHDGHMTIMAGLAERISNTPPIKGRAVILFQPAEEVEQGARDVVENPIFKKFEPDYIFALHNIPGIPKNKILLKHSTFASASKGLTIKLIGKTSHAGEPENGINPAVAISEIVRQTNKLVNNRSNFKDLTISTFIHIKLGEISFGTSPGYGEIRMTLRAFENQDMEFLSNSIEDIIRTICDKEKLGFDLEYSEVFPATVNDRECVEIIAGAADRNKLNIEYLEKPFRWSEDFAYYTENYKGGFFGLGSGIDQPPLHNPDFDFPDDIIESGINMFFEIYKAVLQ